MPITLGLGPRARSLSDATSKLSFAAVLDACAFAFIPSLVPAFASLWPDAALPLCCARAGAAAKVVAAPTTHTTTTPAKNRGFIASLHVCCLRFPTSIASPQPLAGTASSNSDRRQCQSLPPYLPSVPPTRSYSRSARPGRRSGPPDLQGFGHRKQSPTTDHFPDRLPD